MDYPCFEMKSCSYCKQIKNKMLYFPAKGGICKDCVSKRNAEYKSKMMGATGIGWKGYSFDLGSRIRGQGQ